MTIHYLKCWPEFFVHVMSGVKTFEIRRNDRNYQVGDELVLREWEPTTEQFSGRMVRRNVTFVMHGMGNVGVIGPARGLSTGFVVMALSELENIGAVADVMARSVDRAQS